MPDPIMLLWYGSGPVAALAIVACWLRRRRATRNNWVPRDLLGLAALLLACGILARVNAGIFHSLPEAQAKAAASQELQNEPLESLQLHVTGPDPFRTHRDVCALQLQVITIAGRTVFAEVPASRLFRNKPSREGGQTYSLSWQDVQDGSISADARKASETLTRCLDLKKTYRIVVRIRCRANSSEIAPEHIVLRVNGHRMPEVFRSDAAARELVEPGETWVCEYRDFDYIGAVRISSWKDEQARPLHEHRRVLAGHLAGGAFCFALAILLLLARTDRATVGESPFAHASGSDLLIANVPYLLCALGLTLACTLLSEKIPVGDGLGWDGVIYGALTKNPWEYARDPGLDAYWVQRILPSVVLHYVLRGLSLPPTNEVIIAAFTTLNTLLVVLAALGWCQLADRLAIRARGKWLGLIGLILNFAVLKMTAYYPVLTDVPALTLSVWMLHCYLAHRPVSLALLTALGTFTWPTLLHVGALLLLFPRARSTPWTAPQPARWRLHQLLTLAVVGVVVVFTAHLILDGASLVYRRGGEGSGLLGPISSTADYRLLDLPWLTGLSLFLVVVYLGWGLPPLLNQGALYDPRGWWRALANARFFAVLLFLVALRALPVWLSNKPAFKTEGEHLQEVALEALRWPGVFFVAHVHYFGPLLFLGLLRWHAVCRAVHRDGLGITLVVLATFLLSIDALSRRHINLYPLLLPYLVKAWEDVEWRPLHVGLFAGLSFAFSKVWLRIGASAAEFDDWSTWEQFPIQAFYMNHSSWLAWDTYLVFLATAVGAGLLTWFLTRTGRPTPSDGQ